MNHHIFTHVQNRYLPIIYEVWIIVGRFPAANQLPAVAFNYPGYTEKVRADESFPSSFIDHIGQE